MDMVGIAMRIREIAMKVSLLKRIGLAWTISIWVVCVFTLAYGDARDADIFGLKKGMTIEKIRTMGFGTIEDMRLDVLGFESFYVRSPKMPKDAKYITFKILPKNGLLCVRLEWEIDNPRLKYWEIRDILIRKYGKEGFGLRKMPGMTIFDMAEQLGVAKDSDSELWRKSDFDADNKWQLEEIRLSFDGRVYKMLELEYRFQGYWQHRSSQSEKREAERTKKAKESQF